MTVEFQNLISETGEFQKEQLKQFEKFIDTSEDLLKSSAGVEEQTENTYTQMNDKVQQFINMAGDGKSDSSPLLILQQDEAYIKQMETVVIPPRTGIHSRQAIQYLENKAEQIRQIMDQRQKYNE